MFRYFNDMSIRGKLTAIVAGAVAALTTAVLISVWLSSWQEVRKDVHNELEAARHDFVVTEGEHLHEHVLEATTIAESEELQPLLARNDSKGACAWLSGILAGKGSPVNPEDDFDLLAVVLPNGEPLGVVVRGEEPCVRRPVKHPFPALQSKQRVPEITNWESGDDKLYEVIAAPVVDAQGRDAATLMMGFEVTDSMARHIKEHTGQDNIVWHKEGNEFHVLGVSNPGLRSLLTAAVEKSNGDTGEDGGSYAILDTHIEDHADPVFNPKGLHIGLVQSLDDKFEPFRRLEYLLALMAVLALVLGWLLGLFLARPIAMPLVHLAKAADSVAHDQLDSADSLLLHYPDRLINAKDEIGVLGRSFREMVHGLKERLAMVPFVSEATIAEIRTKAGARSTNARTSLAILFADVRQFSAFSETRDPEEVIGLLNEVLSIEADIIKKHNGDIDKFVGDAVVAWFSGEGRCVRALRAGEEIIAALRHRFEGKPGTIVGIGIHVGEVVVGAIGSHARMDYTAIGSSVNLAARLCSAAPAGEILISAAVKSELGGEASLKPLPPISLKGFSEPIAVFQAVTHHD